MATYSSGKDSDISVIQRLCKHHNHLKSLTDSYNYMRKSETYERMQDLCFRCDPQKMSNQDNAYYTSVIIKLSQEEGKTIFDKIEDAYREIEFLIQEYYKDSKPEIYFDSAHITLKSILDDRQLSKSDLDLYASIIQDVVKKWINRLGQETHLYGIGLFTNLTEAKGLSIGIKFYPSLPLVQIIRGEIGNALYNAVEMGKLDKSLVRSESKFHTMLTHSTGFRVRDINFPLHPELIQKFIQTIEKYDNAIFGIISNIEISDIYIRNGKSDKLVLKDKSGIVIGKEVCLV